MVLAGPGSGKTSVIVERTAYMIQEGKIKASSILVVTFSRAAAREMKERYLTFTGEERTDVTFGTFHGVFYGILKLAYHLTSANILSEEEKYEILRELTLLHGGELAQEGDFTEEIAKEIGVVKGNRIDVEHYYSSSCPDEIFRTIYQEYRKKCHQRRKLDFDDMLLYCYDLFRQRPDILVAWQKKFQYILVDEFQDINQLQYEIVRMLAEPLRNLFIVGDDDQSIYHFRGARPEIMLHFPKDYPDAEIVNLDVNYRCSRHVLTSALDLISHNRARYDKKLSTPNPWGEEVRVTEYQTQSEEYREVVRQLRFRLDQGESLEDTALLLRTNQEAEGLIGALMEYQVPFTMKEQLPNLFHHWICRNMLAYLHMAAGDRQRKTFLEIMNRPNRYIAREYITDSQISFEKLKQQYRDKDWMADRITQLETHLRILQMLAPYAGMNFIRKAIGYEEYLKEYALYRKIKPEELLEVLDRIMESAKGMKTLQEWEQYIEDYTARLQEQARAQERDQRQGKGNRGVSVMTLHGSKGLEYKDVNILNVNEGSIPYRKAVLDSALEEERRLLYVGMTRAKKRLTLCYVKRQYEKEREPSRFLEEIGV